MKTARAMPQRSSVVSLLPTTVATAAIVPAAESTGASPPAIALLAIDWPAPVWLERQLLDLLAALSTLEIHAADVVHLAFKAHICHPLGDM